MKRLIPLLLLLISSVAFSGIWYLDGALEGTDNGGTSWVDAWEAFDQIVWGGAGVVAGDTLYISGGASGGTKTYNENLTIGTSGSAGNRITIRNAVDEGHTGTVYITGRIYISNRDYVTVYGFSIYSASLQGGIFIQESDYPIISHMIITTPEDTSVQTDGIYSQRNLGEIIEYNHIVISNNNSSPHTDGIQSYEDEDLTIRNNWVQQADNVTKVLNANGIYITTGAGTIRIYNNVVISKLACNNIATRTLTGTATHRIYGNIVIGGGNKILYVTEDPGAVIKNNIFWFTSTEDYYAASVGNDGAVTPANVDYNIWYSPNIARFGLFNGSYVDSWAEMQTWGAEGHGYNANPDLDAGNEYFPNEGAPGQDTGVTLGSPYNVDKLGVSRPQGAGWDIGAYEYVGMDPPPVTGPFVSDLVAVLSQFLMIPMIQFLIVIFGTGWLYGVIKAFNRFL